MKPRLLDLFCGAGGAAMGYHRAGFEVVTARRGAAVKLAVLLLLLLALPTPSGVPHEGYWTASGRATLRSAPVSGRNPTVSGTPSTEGVRGSDPDVGMASGVTSRPAIGPLQGWATYYDAPSGTAAAGLLLRSGDWRGRIVEVCAGSDCLLTTLRDACWCGPRHGIPTLLDLARSDFARLAPPSSGILLVTVSGATLPQTDVEGTP